jgi:hypothetical protein
MNVLNLLNGIIIIKMDNATLCIKTVLTSLSIAEKYLDQFIIETKPAMDNKKFLNFELKKIQSITKDINIVAGPQNSKIINDEILNNWDTLAINNVLQMMVMMDDEKKIELEKVAEDLLTKQNI